MKRIKKKPKTLTIEELGWMMIQDMPINEVIDYAYDKGYEIKIVLDDER
jgi:hypothetical protein